jgi:hypothetical protein
MKAFSSHSMIAVEKLETVSVNLAAIHVIEIRIY